ncbi:hypothetical protein [Labrenzia sp. 011]|uniref:hypothetical protein n=1 Tax=Labrenzia sp. 011 TaxID=2171494 RepID=UPI000D51A051|nr:hypothetical protein [Labrenzia sp. 011]PVB62236.1 hypothetical protein DCO57_08000 [Labrenzia sp. 011]
MSHVAAWSFERKLEAVLRRSLDKLGPEARRQIEAILTPEALAIVAVVLIAWIASHSFGVGEIIDIILVAVGAVAIGLAVFTGLDHLYDFASGTYGARSERDLDTAADHFAKAVSILGIQAVLAVLFRGAPRTYKGGRAPVGPAPARTPGLRYKPTVRTSSRLAAGEGSTTMWGNIVVSIRGSANDQRIVLLHEKVHQFLTPKLYLLRQFRVESRAGSYMRSSLSRYLEEALAETVAQIGVNGFRQFFAGIKFPVQQGYVYLVRGGGYNAAFTGSGLLTETAGLIASGILIEGIEFEIWFDPAKPVLPIEEH